MPKDFKFDNFYFVRKFKSQKILILSIEKKLKYQMILSLTIEKKVEMPNDFKFDNWST